MTLEEAKKIFTGWQGYMEIADKLSCFFTIVPESFLPYPIQELEEALNIVMKDFIKYGNKEAAKTIQETMLLHLIPYSAEAGGAITDEKALEKMRNNLNLMSEHQELKELKLDELKKTTDSWYKLKKDNL